MNLLMESRQVQDLPFSKLQVGKKVSFTRTISDEDISTYAQLTGDVNPIHIDDEFATNTRFKGKIVYGMLSASLFSTLIGTKLVGKNVIYLSQNCKFVRPVRIGDTLQVVGEIIERREDKKILTILTNIYNQNKELVVEGNAVVMKME